MSGSVEPALVDLDDLCDACRARVIDSSPPATRTRRSVGERIAAALGIVMFVWAVLAVLTILTALVLRLL